MRPTVIVIGSIGIRAEGATGELPRREEVEALLEGGASADRLGEGDGNHC